MGFRTGTILTMTALLFVAGCLQKKTIRGDAFVEKEMLVEMLVDIHLAEGISNDRKFHRRFEADSVDMLRPILQKYGVTREKFDTTMYTYSRYPELMDEVYNEVLIKLNVMLDENDQETEVNREAEQ
jgi:hypothetical protein